MGAISHCSAEASYCSRFSYCRAQCGLEKLQCMGLVASQSVENPEPGIKPMSPALAGGFLANEPPGKSNEQNFEPDI